MIEFKTDEQTLCDLNIFPKHRGDISIVEFFDETKTKGGRDVLTKLMHAPKSSREEIENTISAIQYCGSISNVITKCLDRDQLDFIQFYLDDNTVSLRDNFIDSCSDWLKYKIKPDNRYFLISRSLVYLREHLSHLVSIVKSLKEENLPPFFEDLKDDIKQLEKQAEFIEFLNLKKKNLSFRQVSHFDHIIRKKEKDKVYHLLHLTYLLDAYLSVDILAKDKNLSFPKFIDALHPEMRIKGLFHPFIDNPVRCNYEMGDDKPLCFLTGPNMSGKSTFLKSVGVCVYLSHLGFPVPAEKCQLTVFNGLYTTINLSDDIAIGYSHYYSEVKRVKEIAVNIKKQKKVLVIFDELFRGTNVKDAYDASLLISKGFLKARESLFMISSHIIEVAHELKKIKKCDFKYFDSRLENEIPVNTYQINDGISNERHGLAIVKKEGIMEILNEM